MSNVLQRTVFETSRAIEYVDKRELQAQTGRPFSEFAAVVLKELVDNALDAAETRGGEPKVAVSIDWGKSIRITVSDNGEGIPADTVRRTLDYTTRTSDKSKYRSPTRGAQGNALKTVLGIPTALGSDEPVVIEACGVRHTIRVWIDAAGEVRTDHDMEASPTTTGTRIEVPVPHELQMLDAPHWLRGFALFNPHASVKTELSYKPSKVANTEAFRLVDSYDALVGTSSGWRKYVPTDATSPHWYNAEAIEGLIQSHINDADRGGRDLTLREFVAQFAGLTATAKAKAVGSLFPDVDRLSDLNGRKGRIRELLAVMKDAARAPKPSTLGMVGEAQIKARMEEWYCVRRFWYRKGEGEVDGIPFVVEVAVAEAEENENGDLFTGINFSPTYMDPFGPVRLAAGSVSQYGLRGFLSSAYASPIADPHSHQERPAVVTVHLVCPALDFMDRAKTRVSVPHEMAKVLADALWRCTRELYDEGERRRKKAERVERLAPVATTRTLTGETIKAIVFKAIPEGWRLATGDGEYPTSPRNIFYQIRDTVNAQLGTDKDGKPQTLDYEYFRGTLLPEYQASRETPLQGIYYEPVGKLREPHTDGEIALGTEEVEGYEFPEYTYNKILYVEKNLWPILSTAKIGERYDMALVFSRGYATVAARELFARAHTAENYKLFVLHDADPAGYEIARTLREETKRMPEHRIEVIDIGFFLEEALDMGLRVEEFIRKRQLSQKLVLNEKEVQYFGGEQIAWGKHPMWRCQRIELNMMTAPQTIEYIERKLREHGADEKVIPPAEPLAAACKDRYEQQVASRVEARLSELLDTPTIVETIQSAFKDVILDNPREAVEGVFGKSREKSWREAVEIGTRSALSEKSAELEAEVVRLALERLKKALD